MIYMLNLVFDAGDATETSNGRFKEYDATQPLLQQSQVWLKQANPAVTPNPDTATDWVFVQKDDGPAIQCVVNDQVWMRTAGLNMTGFAARMTTIVARDARKASKGANGKPFQQRASPFPLDGTQQSCVLYDTVNPTYQAASAAGSWVQQLGTVTFLSAPPPPAPPRFNDSYSLIVALTAGVGSAGEGGLGNVRTYAHDPEFDVDGP
jgi:hypothetical protein